MKVWFQQRKKMKERNQIHNPQKKPKDSIGNDRNRLWIKSGNTTMLLTQGITKNSAAFLEERIKTFIKRCGLKLEVTFLITK